MSKLSDIDEKYMRRVFDLALKGWGRTTPNPMVGAVLIKNNKVVGEDFHHSCGASHAEVKAVRKAGRAAKGGRLYVNLEPCNHHGKTPPCTETIINAGIAEVICSNRDTNPNVRGNGFRRLKKHGIKTRSGLLKNEGQRLNEVYFKYKTTGKPFITLKAAMSLDGFIFSDNSRKRYLSGKPFLKYVHRLRTGYDALLIGARTALMDNPGLDVRLVKGDNPVRIVFSDGMPLPAGLKIFTTASKVRTIIVVSSNAPAVDYGGNVEIWVIKSDNKRFSVHDFMEKASKEGVTSILVEGGSEVFDSFLSEKAVDKVILSHSPIIYGGGVPFAGKLHNKSMIGNLEFKYHKWEQMGEDSVFTGYPDFS